MASPANGTLAPLERLSMQIDEAAVPLADAFAARLRAIDPSLKDERDDDAVPMLLADLRQCLAVGPNAEALVALATTVARRIAGAITTLVRHRHGTQALDWALRDLFIDSYTPDQRTAFARTTNLFIELVRHVSPAVTNADAGTQSTTTTTSTSTSTSAEETQQ